MTTTDDRIPVRAAVLSEAPGKPVIEDLLLDAVLEPYEVRVRVQACGLCHSDLHMLDAELPTPLPTVPGHEVAGVVEAVGSAVDDLAVGAYVVACLSMFCGACAECRAGRSWLCVRRNDLGRLERPRPRLQREDGTAVGQVAGLGGLVDRTVLHRNSVVEVPADVPPDRAALLGCAVGTGVGAALRGAAVKVGETVAVIGVGGVGLNVVQGARLAGARRIVAIDVQPAKLDLARRFGATDTVVAGDAAVADVQALTGGGVDHAFDVVGRSATTVQAVQMLKAGRTAWLVGIPPVGEELRLPGLHVLTQAKGVQGLLMGSNRFTEDIPMLADLYTQQRLELDALVSARLPLDDVVLGFDLMRGGGAARAVVTFE
jgi:S-(hydroxymethyl)glutathione dehydrogenase / alcohol dehydrogenase